MKKKTKSSRARRTQFHQRASLLYHTTMAYQELRRGRVEEAERQARWALRIEPGDYDATQLLGLILTRSGRQREALTLLHEALHMVGPGRQLIRNSLSFKELLGGETGA